MAISGLDHINISTARLAETRAFFTKKPRSMRTSESAGSSSHNSRASTVSPVVYGPNRKDEGGAEGSDDIVSWRQVF